MDAHRAWKEMIYNAILSIADLEFQERAWFAHTSTSEVSSFVETISTLFDDAFFVKFLEDSVWDTLGLSTKLHEEMKVLRRMVDSYDGPETHAAILSDPQWHAVVRQAQKVVLMFNQER